jgi:D-alanyl-D-alanine carboxypeptidase/D-alanyl-D-alanine-endopeptidase (penicillin-binding protein 4)
MVIRHLLRLTLAAGLCACPIFAQSPLSDSLRSALASKPRGETAVGACVIDLAARKVVFAHGADEALIPASTMKLFVMAAAIDQLGPHFAFNTVLATDGSNLIVVGDGDPGFGDERLCSARGEPITADLRRWADSLIAAGINHVSGDLIIDESIFDDQRLHPTWEPDDLPKWYAAPVGGLNFNGNCVDLTLSPRAGGRGACGVSVQPPAGIIEIINKCTTGDGTPTLHHSFDSMTYTVIGRCNKKWSFGSVSFPDPGLLFADTFRTVLQAHGVSVAGTIRRAGVRQQSGLLPSSLRVIGRKTTPLTDVLARIGKNSQNLFAECLLKRTGYDRARRSGLANPRGSWPLGEIAIRETLEKLGVDSRNLVVADGSGLSRVNACTARQLAVLLAQMIEHPHAALLYENLAEAGVDGSLRRRLQRHAGRVHAKTGTMTGVRSLAGYIDGETGPRYAFAVMFNGYRGPSTPYKEIQDRFCQILIDAAESPDAAVNGATR